MKKSVLLLSSSPRKGGNSDLLCDRFSEGAVQAGHLVEKIFLNEKNIHYCIGCGTCFDEGKCSQTDDMSEILEKMISTDVIVLSTPVYFYTMCGQMKTLIDRCCARYSEISNKDFYFIVTAAVDSQQSMQKTIEGFRGFTTCLTGPKEKGIIYGTGAWKAGSIKDKEAMTEAFEMGKAV
jgi:multimeric flavodoxin WrbA